MKPHIFTRDIALLMASSFFYLSSPMLVTPLITGFSAELGASARLMGLVGGLMNLCALFCRPLAGNLADRFSRYRLFLLGSGLMSLACLGYAAAQAPAFIVLSRIVNGVGYAFCSVSMSTWISSLLPEGNIGSGMGFYGMVNALGMAVAPAIGVSASQRMGCRASFLIALACSLMSIFILFFVSDRGLPRRETVSACSSDQVPAHPALHLADKKVLPLAAIIMLFAIPYCATQAFLVSYVEARSLPVSVSLFFPAYAVILLLLRFSMKSLFDRLPFRNFLFLSVLSAASGILLLGFMKNNLFLILAAACMAGGYGIMCSVCQSTAILLAGPGGRGLANSTYYIGLDLGMTFGSLIGGFLYESAELAWFYPSLLFTIPLLLLVYAFRLRAHV